MVNGWSDIPRLILCLVASCGLHGGVGLFDWIGETAQWPVAQSRVHIELMSMVATPAAAGVASEAPPPTEPPVPQRVEPPACQPAAVARTPKRSEPAPAAAREVPEAPDRSHQDRARLASHAEARRSPPPVVAASPDSGAVPASAVEAGNNRQAVPGNSHPDAPEPAAAVEAWVDAQPRYRTNPPPVYPYQARVRQWRGQVWLVAEIDASGRVRSLEIERSSGYGILDRAARQAVGRWEFLPARRAGVPVASRVRVPVRFELDQG